MASAFTQPDFTLRRYPSKVATLEDSFTKVHLPWQKPLLRTAQSLIAFVVLLKAWLDGLTQEIEEVQGVLC